MSETYTVTKIERTAGAFDFGDEKSDYTIHHERGETEIQNSYANDIRQAVSDKCDELLGDADAVEPEEVVIEGHAPDGNIEDHNIKALREVGQ